MAALLAPIVALAAATPASAQTLAVINMHNVESMTARALTNPASSSGTWQLQFTFQSRGGCTPTSGQASGTSPWLNPGDQWGASVHLGQCTYTFSAVARHTGLPGRVCNVKMSWEASGNSVTGSAPTLASTDSARGSNTRINAAHAGNDTTATCNTIASVNFTIAPNSVVQLLPAADADADLLARARRLSTVTNFTVQLSRDPSGSAHASCNQTLNFTVRGDGRAVNQKLNAIPSGQTCKFLASIPNPPAPFKATTVSTVGFTASSAAVNVDLSGLVQLRYNPIRIIQDVTGSSGGGRAMYSVARDCGGVGALPPPAGGGRGGIITVPGSSSATLDTGRFLVHGPTFRNFGPSAVYPGVATSTVSSVLGGCSATVTISMLPANCSVTGPLSRTLSWTAANQLEAFDFEFDINCGGAPTITEPPADAMTSADPDVRISARRLADGRVEFALQQQTGATSWSERILPARRYFPVAATARRGWLVSSPVTVTVAASPTDFTDEVEVRITARRLRDGRLEFGLQQRNDDRSWTARRLPAQRFFPTTARVDAWLNSAPAITLNTN